MLKLDPEEVDSDEEAHDKLKLSTISSSPTDLTEQRANDSGTSIKLLGNVTHKLKPTFTNKTIGISNVLNSPPKVCMHFSNTILIIADF